MTNTVTVTINNVVITDTYLTGLNVVNPNVGTLTPGQVYTDSYVLYTITDEDVINGSVTNQAGVKGDTTVPGHTEVADLSDDEGPNDNPTTVTFDSCSVVVYNLVTPNQGSDYDRLQISGLVCHPVNSIEIYNRWGVLVFETTNYNNVTNAFEGVSNGRVTINDKAGLPEGTYYYIFRYEANGQMIDKTGFIHLTR